jgi:adenylate cyclase
MQYRIGINLGDVIYDDSRIYGDGINVAARLEKSGRARRDLHLEQGV